MRSPVWPRNDLIPVSASSVEDVEAELAKILLQLNDIEIQFTVTRLLCETDRVACERLGMARDRVASWPAHRKALIDRAITLMQTNIALGARAILQRSVVLAAQELQRELDDPDVTVRHRAAVQILDRVVGRAVQPVVASVAVRGVDELLQRVWGDGEQPASAEDAASQVIDAVLSDVQDSDGGEE